MYPNTKQESLRPEKQSRIMFVFRKGCQRGAGSSHSVWVVVALPLDVRVVGILSSFLGLHVFTR
jgi:hypothetical protein